jgi:hypothetical protein
MKNLALTVLPLVAFAGLAEARPGTLAEQRGYANCRSVFAADSSGLATPRHYFVEHGSDTARFYINGARWEDGERTLARMTCDTTTGARVLASSIDSGRFVHRNARITIEVADRGN